MAVRIETQAEPLPGYRLIERLGGGGFGEVWKCKAPGGLLKAIKFVFGNLDLAGDSGQRAEQELKALKRVMTVRHPYVLSLERFDIIEGQLLIVMELADRNLWDRYKECRGQGLSGIPRDELLAYAEETAEALDLMNIQYQLQHLDIKPQNIFLIGQHIKVADFGLVKDLEGSQASVTGGITPVYAAPETFDGKVSRYTDQYSFAIVYQEMLTGVRPFVGQNVRQLIMQHLSAPPDLSPLPPEDRPAISRALSKEPDDRFPTCREMVRALRGGPSARTFVGEQADEPGVFDPTTEQRPPNTGDAQTLREAIAPRTPPVTPRPLSGEPPSPGERPVTPPPPPPHVVTGRAAEQGQRTGDPEGKGRAGTAPPAPSSRVPETPTQFIGAPTSQEPGNRGVRATGVSSVGRRTEELVARLQPSPLPAAPPPAPVEEEGDGALVPTLVIGLGGLGAAVLQSLRTALTERFGSPEAISCVRTLLIDTDPEILRQFMARGQRSEGASSEPSPPPADHCPLTPNEILLAPLNRPSYYLRPRDGRASIESWLEPRILYRIPREQLTTGVRALGRLAFCDNFRSIQRRLLSELEACRDPARLQSIAKKTGLGVRSSLPRVVIVASLMGGTGSGMFLDVAYTVRQLLRRLGSPRPDVTGLFFVPQLESRVSRQGLGTGSAPGTTPGLLAAPRIVPLGNTCAALAELHCFAGCDPAAFSAHYLEREPSVEDRDPPFGRTILLPLHPEAPPAAGARGEAQTRLAREAIGSAARYLLADNCTPLMRWADKAKVGLPAPPAARRGQYVQTFGLYRLAFPRRQVVRRVAGVLLQRILERWMSKDSTPLQAAVRAWVGEQWRGNELGAEHFIARVQQACEKRLGQSAEAAFTAAAEVLLPPGTQKIDTRKPINPDALAEVLHRYEALLGRPESDQDANVGSQAPIVGELTESLREASEAIAAEWSQKLAELPVQLIEQPAFRLTGAEEAIRQVVASIERVLQTHEPLSRELTEKATIAFARLMTMLAQMTVGASPARRTAPPSPEAVLELVRSYPKLRYQSLVMQEVLEVYISLRGHLTDTLREINFCRVRLTDLLQVVGDPQSARAARPAGAQKAERGRSSTATAEARPPAAESRPATTDYTPDLEGPGQYLFPGDWGNIDQAVLGTLQLLEQTSPSGSPEGGPSPGGSPPGDEASLLLEFVSQRPPDASTDRLLDERIQEMLRRQFGSLVQVCLAHTNVTRNVARAMREVAFAFVDERLERTDVAGLFLERHPDNAAVHELIALYEEAVPEAPRTSQARAIAPQTEVVVLTTPPGPTGEQLRDAAQEALPEVSLVTSAWEHGDDVLLYREWSNLALTDLEYLGPLGQEAYHQMLAADFPPHARQDVHFEIPT